MPLKRSLNLGLLTFYGLGSIIGAGIYALIGSVAQRANEFTPYSFLFAAIVALFTATTYAELSSRFPQSAGSALYAKQAFKRAWLSGVIGWLVVLTGLVSAAALTHGLINYLNVFITIPFAIVVPCIIILLGVISFWGITESAFTIFLMTVLEICGLLIIIWYGKDGFSKLVTEQLYLPPSNLNTWWGIFAGAFIAFYAFIGFEDMVNVAEETKNPQKTMPIAILLALIGATLLYLIISIVVVTALPYRELSDSNIPLARIVEYQGHSPILFGIIAIVAISNGILVQIIMASRLIYGMTSLNNAPGFFAKISKNTQVPVFAICFVVLAIIVLAYWFPIVTLAKATSTVILCVFLTMHTSLIVIKIREDRVKNIVQFPIIFPITGAILAVALLLLQVV